MKRTTKYQNYAKGDSEEHVEDLQSSFKIQEDALQNDDGPKVSKKFWTKKQDQKLIQLVGKFGQVRWTQISREMSDRSAKRCRERWMNYLDTSKNHSSQWTDKQKWILFLCFKVYGNKWSKISKEIKRGDNIIKNQVNCLKRKKMMPYEGKLKDLMKQQDPISRLTDASSLEIQLIGTLKSRTKNTKNQNKNVSIQERRQEKNQNIYTNIAMPIPTRYNSNNFHPVSNYPISAHGNISNYNFHNSSNAHNIFQHQPNRNQMNQGSHLNSGLNHLFFPPQMSFFPFGFYC